jgi:hypothetical protein
VHLARALPSAILNTILVPSARLAFTDEKSQLPYFILSEITTSSASTSQNASREYMLIEILPGCTMHAAENNIIGSTLAIRKINIMVFVKSLLQT